ncbi:hypothetical protein J8L98_24245 [Pseudoalteromonas sp. MMG013]|uniref:hypothetical protein n=1 Tax=Pseudoalteromonas sp. MMG013 TaxID=2822687 RepID=UPI001B38224D|nr:hypothetical protein [Pseudoalteromonas sp. MMG013]MBQ4864800.1 hypothetical protein [Pseudoalteromonas sp. MMG013]
MGKKTKVYPDIEPREDKLFRVAEVALSLLPAGTQLLHSLISPPIQERTRNWMSEIEERLSIMEKAGIIDLEALSHHEMFSALVLKCIQAAATTSQQEKLEHLKNFVVSLAYIPNIDEDEVYIFFNMLNEFTPSHIIVLKFYNNPGNFNHELTKLHDNGQEYIKSSIDMHGKELSIAFGGSIEYWQSIFSNIKAKYLVDYSSNKIDIGNGKQAQASACITEFGLKLLDLISDS